MDDKAIISSPKMRTRLRQNLAFQVRLGLIALFVLFFIFGLIFAFRTDGKLHIVFCNVGQGDAVYIKTPAGKDVLIDGGPDDKVLSCLSDEMRFFDKTIEFLVLTHPQKDHLAGLVDVLRRYRVKQVLRTEQENKTEEFHAWTDELKKEKTLEIDARQGQVIDFGDDLRAKVLWPPKGSVEADLNDTSIVLHLNYGRFCAFLSGDATNNIWSRVSNSQNLSNCQVLKVAHHGSRNATDDFLLTQLQPKIAVISAGKNNRYGHPHEEVLTRLVKIGAKVLRTDVDGKVNIILDGGEIVVKTDKM